MIIVTAIIELRIKRIVKALLSLPVRGIHLEPKDWTTQIRRCLTQYS